MNVGTDPALAIRVNVSRQEDMIEKPGDQKSKNATVVVDHKSEPHNAKKQARKQPIKVSIQWYIIECGRAIEYVE